jgi:hypothetical protein
MTIIVHWTRRGGGGWWLWCGRRFVQQQQQQQQQYHGIGLASSTGPALTTTIPHFIALQFICPLRREHARPPTRAQAGDVWLPAVFWFTIAAVALTMERHQHDGARTLIAVCKQST